MSSQEIANYLTKQLYIERNVVTYRTLSRQFGIHVNTAKNELAAYHSKAPHQGDPSCATYLLWGFTRSGRGDRKTRIGDFDTPQSEPRRSCSENQSQCSDVDMLNTEDPKPGGEGSSEDERAKWQREQGYNGGEVVEEMRMTLVGEKDLEAALKYYVETPSMHVYSLSPSPLSDGGLICPSNDFVRATDNNNGKEYAKKVGRITAHGIDIKPLESVKIRPPLATLAGPSEIKAPTNVSNLARTADVKIEDTKNPTIATSGNSFYASKKLTDAGDKSIDEAKQAAAIKKAGFFASKPKPKEKEAEVLNNAGTIHAKSAKVSGDVTKPKVTAGFFNTKKTTATASAASKTGATSSQAPKRGVKRKTTLADSEVEEEAESATTVSSSKTKGKAIDAKTSTVADSSTTVNFVKVMRGVVVSDNEEGAEVKMKGWKRKSKIASVEEDEAQRELQAMMDVDDDEVERVSRRVREGFDREPATPVPPSDSEVDGNTESDTMDIDMDMDNQSSNRETQELEGKEEVVKPKPRRKASKKKPIPIGKNGLKKKKVLKSRKKMDDKGYMITEDYSSYESVDEEEAPPNTRISLRGKAKRAHKEPTDDEADASAEGDSKPAIKKTTALSRKATVADPPTESESDSEKPNEEEKAGKMKPSASFVKATTTKPKMLAKSKSTGATGQKNLASFFNTSKKL